MPKANRSLLRRGRTWLACRVEDKSRKFTAYPCGACTKQESTGVRQHTHCLICNVDTGSTRRENVADGEEGVGAVKGPLRRQNDHRDSNSFGEKTPGPLSSSCPSRESRLQGATLERMLFRRQRPLPLIPSHTRQAHLPAQGPACMATPRHDYPQDYPRKSYNTKSKSN